MKYYYPTQPKAKNLKKVILDNKKDLGLGKILAPGEKLDLGLYEEVEEKMEMKKEIVTELNKIDDMIQDIKYKIPELTAMEAKKVIEELDLEFDESNEKIDKTLSKMRKKRESKKEKIASEEMEEQTKEVQEVNSDNIIDTRYLSMSKCKIEKNTSLKDLKYQRSDDMLKFIKENQIEENLTQKQIEKQTKDIQDKLLTDSAKVEDLIQLRNLLNYSKQNKEISCQITPKHLDNLLGSGINIEDSIEELQNMIVPMKQIIEANKIKKENPNNPKFDSSINIFKDYYFKHTSNIRIENPSMQYAWVNARFNLGWNDMGMYGNLIKRKDIEKNKKIGDAYNNEKQKGVYNYYKIFSKKPFYEEETYKKEDLIEQILNDEQIKILENTIENFLKKPGISKGTADFIRQTFKTKENILFNYFEELKTWPAFLTDKTKIDVNFEGNIDKVKEYYEPMFFYNNGKPNKIFGGTEAVTKNLNDYLRIVKNILNNKKLFTKKVDFDIDYYYNKYKRNEKESHFAVLSQVLCDFGNVSNADKNVIHRNFMIENGYDCVCSFQTNEVHYDAIECCCLFNHNLALVESFNYD